MRLAFVPAQVGAKRPASFEALATPFHLAPVDINKPESALSVRYLMSLLNNTRPRPDIE
jgi:hypothetical protein